MTHPPTISIIIPTLNDAPSLDQCLSQFKPYPNSQEIIVVDGESRDDTAARLNLLQTPASVHSSPPGRGKQLHHGAQQAKGRILLFLHADTLLPNNWQETITQVLQADPATVGYFPLRLEAEGFLFRCIEHGVKLRSRWLKLPYGDQAYFMYRETYQTLGGFSDLPMMEDVEFIERAATQVSLRPTKDPVRSSARNWAQDGTLKRTLLNLITLWKYKRGTDIQDLQSTYKGTRPALSIYCKKPEPGKVKTRLAKSIGKTQAADLYREMTENTLREMSRMNDIRLYVTYTPIESYADFYHWLGPSPHYLPQTEGDLGERMLHTATTLKAMGHTHILFIGTDCPDLHCDHINQSLAQLEQHDLVIIPAYDGGYTLIGMKDIHPALFQNIDWSTDQVLSQTLAKAEQANLKTMTLPPLNDIDTVEDL